MSAPGCGRLPPTTVARRARASAGTARVVDAVIPARDEAPTVADVVAAAAGCAFVRQVIVVDDGSSDGTGDLAAAAGAKVLRLPGRVPGGSGSKARAMEAGVVASDADAVLFVDADLLGLTAAHLDDVCRPVIDGRAAMSLGIFDYGRWNWLVLRFPPTTGERLVPRWVFDSVPPAKRQGYAMEVMLNEVIAEGRLPTVARVMPGVSHRTKRDKLGALEGWRHSWRMFWGLVGLPVRRVVRWRTYWFYLRALTVER